jgi:LysM repeat protein
MTTKNRKHDYRMRRFLTIIVISLLSFTSIAAQERFIEHTILKGENVYSISKKYGVTIDAIFELNPNSADIIYSGDILRIPDLSQTQSNAAANNSNLVDYQVKRGETKFGLSKRFGISITLLEQQNPHITNMLQAGHIIKIDKTIQLAPRVSSGENGHIIVKGETLWSISKKYNVSLANLITANSNQLPKFLQIGQTLVIPNKNSINKTSIEGLYLVKRGETKYSLAKRFNMSVPELERKNPHIINMLMAGHKLNVDLPIAINTTDEESNTKTLSNNDNLVETDDNEQLKTNDEQQDSSSISSKEDSPIETTSTQIDSVNTNKRDYVDYVIQPKETLFGLSRKAGMTLEDLIELNPKLRLGVKTGEVIKMPGELEGVTNGKSNSISEPSALNTANALDKNTSLVSNLNTTAINGLYFYSPFSVEELTSKSSPKQILDTDDKHTSFVDFYRGAKMAIDSARALKLKFDITFIEKTNSIEKIKLVSPYKKNALLIPFIEDNDKYQKFVSKENVSVIDIKSNINSLENRIVYKPIPSENFQKQKILNYIASKGGQVVVISDLIEAKNKELIVNTVPDAKFLKVDKAGVFEDSNWQQKLDKNRLNYVILDSDKTILFLNTTTALMNKLPDYDMQLVLINASLIPKQSEVSNIRYKVLKLIYPSTIESSDKKPAINFKSHYKDLYKSDPTKYAILGFDITLDILLRLSQNSSFENTIENTESEHSHIKFNYKKTSNSNYSNTSFYIMQFDSNQGIIKLD